jgi:ABC-2 type transport system ATP-binding protein
MEPLPGIATRDLRKSYGDHLVLDGIDLEVAAGTVYALLGPNGSGKTTTVKILSTLLPPDAGAVRVAGHDVVAEPDAVRAAIGVTGQFSAVDDLLTGEENLRLMADLHHLPGGRGGRRVAALLDRFDLAGAARRPTGGYSGGMRRRLDLAMTLVGDPRIIFLDEPTTGLDPRSRRDLYQVVRGLVADGATVLLTTQYLEEADALADRVALLDRGHFVAEGTPAELKRLVPGGHLRVDFADERALAATAAGYPDATTDTDTLTLRIPSDGSLRSMRAVLDALDERAVAAVSLHTTDLDDVFLALTGQTATDKEPAR